MEQFFNKFLQIEFNHQYFGEQEKAIFQLIPTSNTQNRLKNFNILIKNRGGQFEFFTGLRKKELLAQNELKGIDQLNFFLVLKDALFENYTSIKISKHKEKILHLTHRGDNSNLHKNRFVGDQDSIVNQSNRFEININPKSDTLAQVKTHNGDILLEIPINEKSPPTLEFNLNTFKEGKYELWINNKLDQVFFSKKGSIPQNYVGIVTLNEKNIIQQLTEKGIANYEVNFAARKCFWRYKILVPIEYKINLIEMKIQTSGELEFKDAHEETLSNGMKVNVFTSTTENMLRDTLTEKLELVLKYNNLHSERISEMVVNLPASDPKGLETIEVNNNSVHYASTLINI